MVTPTKSYKADVLIQDDKIAEVWENISNPDAKVIDAEGKYILPGVIDVHTHMNLRTTDTVSADDFFIGTKAAAFGGVTTIIDFATQEKGKSLHDALDKRKKEANISTIDYGLHIGVTDVRDEILDEMVECIKEGNSNM